MREFSEQEIVRRNKVLEINKFTNPYPEKFVITHDLKEASILPDETKNVSVAGRITLMRKMGKLSFLTISDIEGELQLSIKIDLVGETAYQQFKEYFDLGDFIGATGEIFTTHTGEKTLRADSFTFLGKALKPLPEKFHGLVDTELCYRNRYVDLIMNEDTKKRFLLRSKFVKNLRNYLDNLGYLEIETPILNNKPSGALAKPFMAHHNALDQNVYLRIAPETYLKRAVIGGFNKVYEIARCFRNEGMDASHLQDFTMVEGYTAYFNYKDNMKFISEMIKSVVFKTFNSLQIPIGDKIVDLDKEWEVVTFRDIIMKYANIDINEFNTKELLLKEIKNKKLEIDSETPLENLGYGNLVDQLYKKVARPSMVGPVFLTEHPISLSPLARANDENKELTDRFQLVMNGEEIVNAYSELVDPVEQEKRLLSQQELKTAGDEEAMMMDYDYIEAMEYGMPPISGWGLGVDRLLQLMTQSDNVKDVVMFPLMRPKD